MHDWRLSLANGEGLARSCSLYSRSLDGTGSDKLGNLAVETGHNFENGPTTMSYFHQNSISWPAAPTNGLMPYPHPNHYLYAGPLGYGWNED
ncbi:hypothetical protein S83_004803 [Arachis hypogaea]